MDITVQTRFSEEKQDTEWQNEVAKQLNTLLGRAVDFYLKAFGKKSHTK
jgi:hypothetical protein